MKTVEERVLALEAKTNKMDTFIKKFLNIKHMVVRKSENGKIQLRDVEK